MQNDRTAYTKSAFSRARRYWQRAEDTQKVTDVLVALRYNVESSEEDCGTNCESIRSCNCSTLLEFTSNLIGISTAAGRLFTEKLKRIAETLSLHSY